VEHQPVGSISGSISFFKSDHDKLHVRFGREMPCERLTGEQVNHYAKIIPFTAGFDIGKIADPYEIGGTLGEILF